LRKYNFDKLLELSLLKSHSSDISLRLFLLIRIDITREDGGAPSSFFTGAIVIFFVLYAEVDAWAQFDRVQRNLEVDGIEPVILGSEWVAMVFHVLYAVICSGVIIRATLAVAISRITEFAFFGFAVGVTVILTIEVQVIMVWLHFGMDTIVPTILVLVAHYGVAALSLCMLTHDDGVAYAEMAKGDRVAPEMED
jgi:hypothetical protein